MVRAAGGGQRVAGWWAGVEESGKESVVLFPLFLLTRCSDYHGLARRAVCWCSCLGDAALSCLLRSASCCGVTEGGVKYYWCGAGKDFQERRERVHTTDPNTTTGPPWGRFNTLRGSSLSGTRPGGGLRLFATGRSGGCLERPDPSSWLWGPFINREYGELHFPGIRMALQHQERRRRGEKSLERAESERICPTSSFLSLTGRAGRPMGGHRQHAMRHLGFGSPPASTRGTSSHPPSIGGHAASPSLPLDSRAKKQRRKKEAHEEPPAL